MNANLFLNSISANLSKNKFDEIRQYLLNLPWRVENGKKFVVGEHFTAELREVTTSARWVRMIEIWAGDYWLMMSSIQITENTYQHKFNWKLRSEMLHKSATWEGVSK